jgi:hypothetical protein
MHYKLFAQLRYLVEDLLLSGKRDFLQSFQSSLTVYKDVDSLALQALVLHLLEGMIGCYELCIYDL